MRVLLIEDDATLRAEMAHCLREGGIAVDLASDAGEALDKAWINGYDVILLDRDLRCGCGDDVCREMVDSEHHARILMLTASGSVEDCVNGLSIGADDYLTKPFAMPELLARVHALNRRAVAPTPPVLTYSDIEIEPAKHLATRLGRDLNLTRKEFGVLETLMAARGQVVSAEQFLEKVWDENIDPFTNAIRVTIMTLRRKLGDPPVIETVTGVGYRLA